MRLPNDSWFSKRRRLLGTLGLSIGGGLLPAMGSTRGETADSYVLVQGERCVPVAPLAGQVPVEEFYSYQLKDDSWAGENGARDDGGPYFSSAGTQDLQRHDTSLLFLYDGPGGLSLVVVHGAVGPSPEGGGSATFAFTGLPTDGQWVVKDDHYLDPETGERAETNYDRWNGEGASQTVSWTWNSAGTDGGAFRGLGGDFAVGIDPAFNEAAARLGKNYEGRVTEWQVLSGDLTNPERYSLALDQPVAIRPGSCDGQTSKQQEKEDGQRQTKHQRKQEKRQQKHERKQRKHQKKRERKQRKHERKQQKHQRKQQKHERKRQKHERKQKKHEKD